MGEHQCITRNCAETVARPRLPHTSVSRGKMPDFGAFEAALRQSHPSNLPNNSADLENRGNPTEIYVPPPTPKCWRSARSHDLFFRALSPGEATRVRRDATGEDGGGGARVSRAEPGCPTVGRAPWCGTSRGHCTSACLRGTESRPVSRGASASAPPSQLVSVEAQQNVARPH